MGSESQNQNSSSASSSVAGPNPFQHLIGQVVDGRYKVVKILGQGGMGVVFLATQTSMKRDVALKMLSPALATTPMFAERFRREAEVVSRLKHPGIISIFDFGQTPEGWVYYTMELLEGENLKSIVKRDGPMTLGRAINIVEQIGGALAYAHSQNILHRDMKPHNVMLSIIQHKDFAKVLDFGLVKMVDDDQGEENLTTTGQVLGTPAYMCPKYCRGRPFDATTEVFAFGCVIAEVLTGQVQRRATAQDPTVVDHAETIDEDFHKRLC